MAPILHVHPLNANHGPQRSELAEAIFRICTPPKPTPAPAERLCPVCFEPCTPGCDSCSSESCIEEILKMDAQLWAPDSSRADAANDEEGGAMARKPRRGNVTVFTSHYDEETDIETDINVECLVTPGEREIRWGDNACPGSPPEVEIIEALDDTGKDWREEIESDGRWFDRVSEDAINEANEYDGPDTIAEARGER